MGLARTAICFITILACSTAVISAVEPSQPRVWAGSLLKTQGQHFLLASDNAWYQLVYPAGNAGPKARHATGSRVTVQGHLAPGVNSSILVTASPQEIKDLPAIASGHDAASETTPAHHNRRSLVARRRLQPIQEVSGSFTSITMRINVCGEEPPYTHQEVSSAILGSQDLSLKSFFEQCSFGKMSVSTSSDKNLVVEQVVPVRGSACSGFSCSSLDDLNKLAQEAENYCQETLNIDMTKYSIKILLLPESFTGCKAGIRLGYIGCFQAVPGPDTPSWRCRSWVSGSDLRSIIHEVLHNVGLGHAGMNGNDYGDGLCPMGAAWGTYCPNAYHSAKLGWSRSAATLDLDQVGADEWFVRTVPARAKQSDSVLLLTGRSPEDDLYVSFLAPTRFERNADAKSTFKVLIHQERKENNQKSWLLGSLDQSERLTSKSSGGAEWVIRFDSYSDTSMEAVVRVCKSTASGHCDDQSSVSSTTTTQTRQSTVTAVPEPSPDPSPPPPRNPSPPPRNPPSPPPQRPPSPSRPAIPVRPAAPFRPATPVRSPSPPPRQPSAPGTPGTPPSPPPGAPPSPSPPSPPPPSPPGAPSPSPPPPEPEQIVITQVMATETAVPPAEPVRPVEPDFPPLPGEPPSPSPPSTPGDSSQTLRTSQTSDTQTQTQSQSVTFTPQPVFITQTVRRTNWCTARARCGDGICDAWAGENCISCKKDCLRVEVQAEDGQSRSWCCGGPSKLIISNSGSSNSGQGNSGSGSGNSGSGKDNENENDNVTVDRNDSPDTAGDGCLVGGQSGMCTTAELFCRPMCPPPTFWILKWLKKAYRN